MFLEFEWDDRKADENYRKHQVRFSEAATVWLDGAALEILDPDQEHGEERWIRMGISRCARILVVVFVERAGGTKIRIISARKARAI